MSIIKQIIVPNAPLLSSPSTKLSLISEGVFGEFFNIITENSNWSYGYLKNDGYRGWVLSSNLGSRITPNHRVITNSSLILEEPNVKSNLIYIIPIGSFIRVVKDIDGWCEIQLLLNNKTSKGYCPSRHLLSIKENINNWSDFKKIMLSMLGTPYLWGGKTNFGSDCSGILQNLLYLIGLSIPRDTPQQIEFFNQSSCFIEIKLNNNSPDHDEIIKGDIIFWEGHVGIMFDKKKLFHANAFHMNTSIEPLKTTIKRFNKQKIRLLKIFRYLKY